MRPKFFLMEDAGDGTDGKGAGSEGEQQGGDGKKGADNGEISKSMEMVLRSVAVLAQGVTKNNEAIGQLLEHVKNAKPAAGAGEGEGEDGKGDEKGLFDGVDLEQLDRKDLVALIVTKFEGRLQHHLKDITKGIEDKINGVNEVLQGDLAQREVAAAQNGRPDFIEWRPEIAALIKDNPRLNVVRAYTIARSEDTKKAAEMDKKYAKKDEAGEGKPRKFSGFIPGSGGNGRGEGATKMKFTEAAEKAWNDVISGLDGVDIGDLPVVGSGR